MKYAFILFSILFAFTAQAQRVLSVDSTWVSNVGGSFYENHLIAYDNGEQTMSTMLLGDANAVLNKYKDAISTRMASMAVDVEGVSDYARQIKEIIRQDPGIKSAIGKSPLEQLLAPVDTALIDSTYRVRINGAIKSFKFSLNAQGVLRYKVDTFAVRQAVYLGSVLRLNNWLNSGKPLDLFLFRNGRWYDNRREVQLYLQSAGFQARDVPDIAAFDEVLAPPSPILYDGGYANLGGIWYKWSAAKKTWAVAKKPKAPKASKL